VTRLLPHPWLSAALFVASLMLWGSLGPLQLAGNVLLAVAIPLVLIPLDAPQVALARPAAAVRLSLVVLWDIVVANVAVARLILGPIGRLRPAFVEVPLDTPHPHVATLLAMIVTMTPGTVSSDIDEARTRLLVHVLDTRDAAGLVAVIKTRYERPLKEIFGC
jgi:multicomponent K+:H+ antiporter subunit E